MTTEELFSYLSTYLHTAQTAKKIKKLFHLFEDVTCKMINEFSVSTCMYNFAKFSEVYFYPKYLLL